VQHLGSQAIVVVAGLPYSGKTAIIERLMRDLPGKAVFIDAVFRDIVEEKDVCLERWLAEGTRLVDSIIDEIAAAAEPFVYVEIGILQPRHRDRLMAWARDHGRWVLPVLLECASRQAVCSRQAAREVQLARGHDRLKIAIGMDELEGPIRAAFVTPADGEGFLRIDTSQPIEENIREIRAALVRSRCPRGQGRAGA
jgi:hypothetical protein